VGEHPERGLDHALRGAGDVALVHNERVVITRRGAPAAVLISPADLAALDETLDVLSDLDAEQPRAAA
jgi:prevent-host-death family protein